MSKNKENYINKSFEHDRDKFEKGITLNARAMLIANEVANGVTYRQIVSKYMNEWGVSYNYMHSIITESLNLFKSEELYKNIRDINNERLTNIYQTAMQNGELDTAIKAIDKLNKSNGVYDTEKPTVQVQAEDSNIVITFGGQTVQELGKHSPENVPYNEVDSLIKNTLDQDAD